MSLSSSSTILASSERKKAILPTLYQTVRSQGYKHLNYLYMKDFDQIVSVTVIAAFFASMDKGELADFNQLFVRAFGEQNLIHAPVLWERLEISNEGILAFDHHSLSFMATCMKILGQSISCDSKEQAQFEQTSAANYPHLCSDEAYLFNQISQRLAIRISILLSQTQQIIFGEQCQDEIILVKMCSNTYYFLAFPKTCFVRFDCSIALDKYLLPLVINHSDSSRSEATFSPRFHNDTLRSILSFLHSAGYPDELEPFNYVSKYFKQQITEYTKQYDRRLIFKSLAWLNEPKFVGTSIEYYLSATTAVFANNPRLFLATKDDKIIEELDKVVAAEKKLPEDQQYAIRVLALKRFQVTKYVAQGAAAELKAFIEAKENADFDLNFCHEIFISLLFVNALNPNPIIEAILEQHQVRSILSPAEMITKCLDPMHVLLERKSRKEATFLINTFAKRLPNIERRNFVKDDGGIPVVISILLLGIMYNLPILEAVNHLMKRLSESGISLSDFMSDDGRPWILDIIDDISSGDNAINILEVALRNGLDKTFFTSDEADKVKFGIYCLGGLATLPLRVLALFVTLYPDFYATNLDKAADGDYSQMTALHKVACSQEFQNIFFLLESQLIDINKTDRRGYNFFHYLISDHDHYESCSLIERVIHAFPELKKSKTKTGLSPFLMAAKMGKYHLLEILESKDSLQERDIEEDSALHLILKEMDINICRVKLAATVRKLLAMGHDINVVNKRNETPIVVALKILQNGGLSDNSGGYILLFKLIRELLTNIDPKQFALNQIELFGHIFRLKDCYQPHFILMLLKQKKLSPNTIVNIKLGMPLLVYAVEMRYINVVRYLLTETDVNVNQRIDSCPYEKTAFYCCIQHYESQPQDEEMVALFLQNTNTKIMIDGYTNTFADALSRSYELAFKLLTSTKMDAYLATYGAKFVNTIALRLAEVFDNFQLLNEMLVFLLNRNDVKYDVPIPLFLRGLGSKGQAFLEAKLVDTFKLVVLNPNASSKQKSYQYFISLCSKVEPDELAVSMKNILIAREAIMQGEICLQQNEFKEAECHFSRARKFDNDLLDKYRKQVTDRFKNCYSFTADQLLFITNDCRPAALLASSSDDDFDLSVVGLFALPNEQAVAALAPPVNAGQPEEKKSSKRYPPRLSFLSNAPAQLSDESLSVREFRVAKQ